MSGKIHKMIGVAVGVALTIYGVGTGRPIFALGMISAPIGAMLPDIDHDRSKIGSTRKKITNAIKWVVFILSVFFTALFFFSDVWKGEWMPVLLQVFVAILLVFSCLMLANTPKIKKKLKFFTKHRGVMHTLLIPTLLLWLGLALKADVFDSIFFGIALGYFSHLLLDCFTRQGCPLVWPVSKKNVHVLNIREKTIWESILCVLLSAGIIGVGIWFGYC